jgi:uncharacterized protein (TIGR03382 family)
MALLLLVVSVIPVMLAVLAQLGCARLGCSSSSSRGSTGALTVWGLRALVRVESRQQQQ